MAGSKRSTLPNYDNWPSERIRGDLRYLAGKQAAYARAAAEAQAKADDLAAQAQHAQRALDEAVAREAVR
jgi:hypothetical protein